MVKLIIVFMSYFLGFGIFIESMFIQESKMVKISFMS